MTGYLKKDKTAGMLLGMAIGDALGAPGKGMTKEEIQEIFGALDRHLDSFDLGAFVKDSGGLDPRQVEYRIYRWRPAGVYTDDTQQALVLSECLIHDSDLLGENFAQMLCELAEPEGRNFLFGIFRGAGKSFRESVRALKSGTDWRRSGKDSASNGAAMRVAPLGAFFWDDLEKLKQRVIDQSILTHRDAMAIAAAQAVAHAVAIGTRSWSPPDPSQFLAQVVQHVKDAEDLAVQQEEGLILNIAEWQHGFSAALERVAELLDEPLEEGLANIGEYAEARSQREGVGATGGYVLSSVITAVYIFLKNIGTYERAVAQAVNQGGDSDTIGAMTGAMAGALHGQSALPARWLRPLANRTQIKLRAFALAGDASVKAQLKPLRQIEQEIMERISALRAQFLPSHAASIAASPEQTKREETRSEQRGRGDRQSSADRQSRRPNRSNGQRGGKGYKRDRGGNRNRHKGGRRR